MIFHKYPKIRLIGHKENEGIFENPEDDIVIEEKVDGANFRFMISDGRLIFGSRTQNIGDNNQEICGNWKRCVDYIKEKMKDNLPRPKHSGYIFYGEYMLKHSISYDWDRMPVFLGFDIMRIGVGQERFLEYEEKRMMFMELGLEVVPLIAIKKVKDIESFSDKDVPQSAYYSGQCEGMVMKNYSKQLMAKYVMTKFREVNKKVFGVSKRFAENDDERIVAMYCTNARIDKMIFNLIDEGIGLEMKMMDYLPKRVIEDIYEEHWKDICYSSLSVSFRNIRKKISRRCVAVLKNVIENNKLNK